MPATPRSRRVRSWLFASSVLVATGCALVSGLDQYDKGDAETSIDATPDQTTSDVANDSTQTPDSGSDAQSDVANDVVADAQDGGTEGDAAGGDCGATNTVDNCSMCGAICDGGNATATGCNGTTCQYTCKNGFSNCDTTAPDLNGCECATPSCCGSSCAVTHANGVGENYYDCVEAGTYNQTQAAKACTAYTDDQFACNQAGCTDDGGDMMICGYPDGGGCVCWTYVGPDESHVYKSGSTTCFCPSTNDPTWN